jgi:hypothetical protein
MKQHPIVTSENFTTNYPDTAGTLIRDQPTYTYSRALQIILIDYPDGTEYRDRGQSAADLDEELRNADELERAYIFEQLHELAQRSAEQ